MTSFEEKVLRDLAELKAHMRWVVGNGNEGKLQEMESRIAKHDQALQRVAGVGAAFAAAMTVVHFVFDYLRTVHR